METPSAASTSGLSKEELAERKRAKMAALLAKQQAKAADLGVSSAAAPGGSGSVVSAFTLPTLTAAERIAQAREFLGVNPELDKIPDLPTEREADTSKCSPHAAKLFAAARSGNVVELQAAIDANEKDIASISSQFLEAQLVSRHTDDREN